MKVVVETTGDFQLLDPDTGTQIRYQGVTLAESSAFLQSRIALGQVKVWAQVPDEATDESLLEYVAASDGNLALAVEAFVSSFTTPAPKKGKKEK